MIVDHQKLYQFVLSAIQSNEQNLYCNFGLFQEFYCDFTSEKGVNCRYVILIFVTLECCQYCFFCRRRLQCGLWTCCSAECDLESSFCFLGMYIRHTVQQIRLPDVYPHSGDVGFPCSYVPKVCAVLWLGQSWDCYYDGKYNATYSQCHQGKARL